jgi:hypothetical protein
MIRTQATIVLAFAAATLWLVQAQDLPRLAADTDLSLILKTWRVKGVLTCPFPCLWVENAFPVGFLEVVRMPYRSGIREFDAAMSPLRKLAPKTTSSHTDASDGSGSTLQFADARVFEFVHPLDGKVIARPERTTAGIRYISELDRVAWRSPLPDLLMHPGRSVHLCDLDPRPKRTCAGSWGNYYPRHGFVTRGSEPIAAFLQGLRAGRAAFDPRARVVVKRYPFEPRTGHWIQMLAPVVRRPVRIGDPDLSSMERGALARDGRYVFAHFGIFERCYKCLPGRLVKEK